MYLENQLVIAFVKVPRHAANENIVLKECAPVPNLYTCVESYELDAHYLIVLRILVILPLTIGIQIFFLM